MSILSSTESGKHSKLTLDDLRARGYTISDPDNIIGSTRLTQAIAERKFDGMFYSFRLAIVWDIEKDEPKIISRNVWVKNHYPDIVIPSLYVLEALEEYKKVELARDYRERPKSLEKKLKKEFLALVL